jgi:Domain of unknown function (DUF4911)
MSPAPHFESMLIAIPPVEIVTFKSIVESYDNLATLRTEDPRTHRLRIYFAPEARAEVEALLESLSERFQIQRLV